MSCAFSRDLLALHVENDLPDTEERLVAKHVLECADCATFLEQLSYRQSQLRQLRRESIHPSAFASLRRDVLSQIENASQTLGWTGRIERTLFLGFRRHAAVLTSLAIAAVVSATLFGQMRLAEPNIAAKSAKPVAVFAGSDTLVRPDGYRKWVSLGSSSGRGVASPHIPANSPSGFIHDVYMDQSAFREFSETGKFPEGTVLILETSTKDIRPLALEASVKDSRFDGGWGFFSFADSNGVIQDKAQVIADKNSCRSCHEENAGLDHVFTQFQPVLKTAT